MWKAFILCLTRTNSTCRGIQSFTVSRGCSCCCCEFSRNYPAEMNPAKCWVSSSSPSLPSQEVLSTLWTSVKLLVTKDLGLCPPGQLVICLLFFYFGYFYLKQTHYEKANAWPMPKSSCVLCISPWMRYNYLPISLFLKEYYFLCLWGSH